MLIPKLMDSRVNALPFGKYVIIVIPSCEKSGLITAKRIDIISNLNNSLKIVAPSKYMDNKSEVINTITYK